MSLYFKECQVIGVENIPKNKPIIYVLNHSNQFVDSFFIALKSPHPVSYLMAAVSYNQGAVGFLSKLFETIPVERPWDNAIDGLGKIEPQTHEIVKGHGTQFTKQARAGDTLLIKGFLEYTIAEIKSDTEMIIKSKSKDTCELEGLMDYKIAPKINQASIFRNVTDALKDERWIVIFPEGCAHDRTDLLPLKAGVSIIGLETMAKYKDLDLSLVCWGLKYSHPSRFRSKVTIEFGTPFKIDSKHIDEYEKDKSTARNKFLGVVESKLREVIFTAPSYKELTSIYLAKRLFLPTPMNSNFSNEEINDIYKKFFDLYNSHKEEQDIKELFDDVYEYGRELKSIGIRDSQLYQPNFKFTHLQYLSIKWALNLILLIICLLPGLTMMAPLGFYSRAKAERVRLLKKE